MVGKQLWGKVLEAISHNGEGSEKRITKFAVVTVMLLLTAYDAIFISGLRIDIVLAWFGLIGYDGFRSTNEKKIVAKTEVDKIVAEKTS